MLHLENEYQTWKMEPERKGRFRLEITTGGASLSAFKGPTYSSDMRRAVSFCTSGQLASHCWGTITKCLPTIAIVFVLYQKQGYGVVSDPFENAFFFLSSRLDTWELPCIWTSGLKPLFSFFTLFARRGNINPFFDGICVVSWRPVLFFFRRFFALQRQAESKGWHLHCVSTWSFSRAPKLVYRFACLSNLLFWFELSQRMLTSPPHPTPWHGITCVTSTCLCTQEKHSSVASKMCASSKNVNIPTPPHPMTWHHMRNINMFMYTRKTQ